MGDELDSLPAGQVAFVSYCRGEAPKHGMTERVDEISGGKLLAALEALAPQGSVLHLSCGSGRWIQALAKHASEVTGVDASPKVLRVAAWRIRDDSIRDRVRFVEGDVFDWEPDQRYDVVFFRACLSYVSAREFNHFWALIADSLNPGGRVFFIDQPPPLPGQAQAIPPAVLPAFERFVQSGTRCGVIKTLYGPDQLPKRLAELGWSVAIHPVSLRLFYATATREHQ